MSPAYKAAVVDYYDHYSTVKYSPNKLYARKMSEVRWLIHSDSRILDAGCGNGDYSIPLSALVAQVVAVDLSEKMLEELHRRSTTKNIATVHADLAELAYDQSFDIAISFSALYYISDLAPVFRNINRALKSGGSFVLDFGNADSLGAKYFLRRYAVPQFFLPTGRLLSMLRSAGFEIVKVRSFELIPHVNVPFLGRLLDFELFGFSLDEAISSLPCLDYFAFRKLVVCRKVSHSL